MSVNTIERLPRIPPDAVAKSLHDFAPLARRTGAHLYAELCDRIPDDPELVEIVSHALASFPGPHLFFAVNFLLLRDPKDPLARYYGNLTDNPARPEQAFPDFARYCKAHRGEIVHLMRTRTIQATFVERCQTLLPLASHVADLVGEPLNLIEIGCSAGLLLTFDQYAYDVKGRGRLGSNAASLTLNLEVRGGPEVRIPKIGQRIGLDLRPVDVKSADERLWLLAQFPPEEHVRQKRLAAALDTVARTDITFFEGDALEFVPEQTAKISGPLFVYHSNCLIYWSEASKAALDEQLKAASRGREIYRMGVEPEVGRSDNGFEMVLTRYRDGEAEGKVVADSSLDSGTLTWRD